MWSNANRGTSMTRRPALAPISSLVFALGLSLVPSGCARNPVTGKNELSLVSESQEIEMGKQSAQQVAQSIGYYEDPGVQAYVSEIGMKMAKASERPDLPWEFHVVNDASVNAFALPGGFIYVTRGPDDLDQRRGRARHRARARDRPRHQPALGAADQQGAGGPARPRGGKHPVVGHRAGGRAGEPGPGRPVPQVQPRRREPGRPGGLPLRLEPELRRARDDQRLRRRSTG